VTCGQSDLGALPASMPPSSARRRGTSIACLETGKPNSGIGVDKSLPVAYGNARKAASTLVHTVCNPKSSGPLLQPAVTLKPGHPLGAELG
jgi:hypothetical protein